MADVLFLGIDLAWTAKARTGLAAVDGSGALIDAVAAVTDDEIADWLGALPGRPVVVAVDAPLVVPNASGQREGENAVAKAFGKYNAGPYSSSRSQPMFDPPRAEVLAERFDWVVDPAHRGTIERPACIEVYPHPAMVGLFKLGERLLYKKGQDRAAGFRLLVGHLESIAVLQLDDLPIWLQLKQTVARPGPGDLNRIEDVLDAILCAHLAWLWHNKPGALRVYGSMEGGYIVAPPPPTHRAVQARARVEGCRS